MRSSSFPSHQCIYPHLLFTKTPLNKIIYLASLDDSDGFAQKRVIALTESNQASLNIATVCRPLPPRDTISWRKPTPDSRGQW